MPTRLWETSMNVATTTTPKALEPLRGPQVWYGPEMAARTDWIRPLTRAEVDELETAVMRLDATGIDIAAIGPKDLNVPGLRGLVEEIRAAVLHGRGFHFVR